MESLSTIEKVLERLSRRRRLQNGIQLGSTSLLWGVGIWLGSQVLYKLAPVPESITRWAALGAGLLTLGGFLAGYSRRPSLLQTAQWIDERLKLQERLSTAWELRNQPGQGEWQALVARDAMQVLRAIDPQAVLPFTFHRTARWALGLALVAAGLGFVPAYRSPARLQAEQDAKVITETGKALSDLTRQQIEQRRPTLQPTEKALQEVLEFGEKLQQVSATRNEALKDLASLTQKLEKQFQDMAEKPALRTLEKAAREPGAGAAPEDLQRRMDALKQALGKAAGKEEAIDKLKRDLENLKRSADALPKGDSNEAQAAREKLAESLSNLAQQAKQAGLSMASLDEAVEALRNSQTDFFVRDLNNALQELDKLQELGKNLQQLQQEMAKAAKDLAEQLKMGQAKAAQSTLEKMIRQLRSGSLSAEDLKKMLAELQDAKDPAKDYGQVAEHLKNAAEKLGQCRNPGSNPNAQSGLKEGAAGDLAKASKELEQLLQQMADADQLAAAMESLQRAQMAIGNCQGFGQCKSPRPRFGKGGKAGRGVGTWAEEDGWSQIPEQTKGWDNSGITQPELDAKGTTDRGEPEHNPNLAPTKVRGQMSPGGSMQSITLKGVHIKGQSQVKFTEAAATAQADAQNALNQDQVPKAYQQSVRDYFDDFKK